MPKGLITVQGDKRLLRLYKNLNVTPGQHRAITRKAANIVKTQTRRELSRFKGGTGELKDSVVVKTLKRINGSLVAINNYKYRSGSANSKYQITNKTLFKILTMGNYKNNPRIKNRTEQGPLIQIAAGKVEGKVRQALAKGYGSLLKRKLRKF